MRMCDSAPCGRAAGRQLVGDFQSDVSISFGVNTGPFSEQFSALERENRGGSGAIMVS